MIKQWETENKEVFCPVNGWDCYYFKEDGECTCPNVENNCDDFYFFWSEEIEAERNKND